VAIVFSDLETYGPKVYETTCAYLVRSLTQHDWDRPISEECVSSFDVASDARRWPPIAITEVDGRSRLVIRR
jgi:hypothetical protein